MAVQNKDFNVACDFFRNQINKTFTLTHDQRLTLSALYNQAKHGAYTPEKAPDIGIFDFVGKERRAKWQSLAQMSEVEAQDTFIQTLIQICPQFSAHLDTSLSLPETDFSNGTRPPSSPQQKLNLKQIFSSQESKIRKALNAQTVHQFREYAAQHQPDDAVKQAELIQQLQDCHFHQYMKYLEQTAIPETHLSNSPSAMPAAPVDATKTPTTTTAHSEQAHLLPSTAKNDIPKNVPEPPMPAITDSVSHPAAPSEATEEKVTDCASEISKTDVMENGNGDEHDSKPLENKTYSNLNHISDVQMWTRKEVEEFKRLLIQDPESVVNVGSGELVTIRVPSVPSGKFLVWEFATDNYDIGFGLYFEWMKPNSATSLPPSLPTSSTPWKNFMLGSAEPLRGVEAPQLSEDEEPAEHLVVEELIPISRASSHTEVYCGSHAYPGKGTYLLKFDNTYSLWRSKVLYYRVDCTA